MPAALDVSCLDFAYDKTLVLENVTFSVENHSFVALIGPNGGGKSTLLKLMMGFLKPTKGSVKVFGIPPGESKKKIGYVPQIRDFDPKFPVSVLDVILMGLYQELSFFGFYPKDVKKKAQKILGDVGLGGFEKKFFGSLSGGQAQRVLIARALLHHPEILFLDEPTASIDPETQKIILSLLLERRKKMTIIMVTHQIADIIPLVDAVFTVQTHVHPLHPKEVCNHFALGLYHDPLT